MLFAAANGVLRQRPVSCPSPLSISTGAPQGETPRRQRTSGNRKLRLPVQCSAGSSSGSGFRNVLGRLLPGKKKESEEKFEKGPIRTEVETPPVSREVSVSPVVCVVGANGRLGSRVVAKFLSRGWHVKALIYKKRDLLESLLKPEGREGEGEGEEVLTEDGGRLECIGGFDITKKETYPDARVLGNVRTLCLVVGGSRTDLDEENYSPFNAEALGVKALLDHFKAVKDSEAFEHQSGEVSTSIGTSNTYEEVKLIDFGQDESKTVDWSPLNDTIMGGNSRSEAFCSASERNTLNWTGELVFADGGFCGVRSSSVEDLARNVGGNVNVDAFDGIKFTVLGDGQRYKMSIRTRETSERPESSFQCPFETSKNEWREVKLRFEDFVAVNQTVVQSGANAPKLIPSEMLTFGLVLSRFSFNGLSNTAVKEGNFLLQLKGGVSLFKEERPSVVLVSSAAVERNQNITSEEQRMSDIPIVQLNPRKILNAKYLGETYVRDSGLNYCVVRPTGLKQEVESKAKEEGGEEKEEEEEKTFCLELSQGDTIAGTILRDEVAEVVCMVAQTSYGNRTTFEVASRESAVKNLDPDTVLKTQFLKLVPDYARTQVGISPFPKPDEPPN